MHKITRVSVWTQLIAMATAISVYQEDPIHAQTKIEIKPIEIECALKDTIIIPVPVYTKNCTLYYLTKPNGITMKLNITRPSVFSENYTLRDDQIEMRQLDNVLVITRSNYNVLNTTSKRYEFYSGRVNLTGNEMIIGPVAEDDHGNWVVSGYYIDLAGELAEVYQVISVIVTKEVAGYPAKQIITEPSDITMKFANPVENIETCELVTPSSAADRYYDRDTSAKNLCGYILRDANRNDSGVWKIVGVGRIVYRTTFYLRIL